MTKPSSKPLSVLIAILLLPACGPDVGDRVTGPAADLRVRASEAAWSPWSAPVHLGPLVNSEGQDIEVAISRDGLSLYFSSNGVAGGFGGFDIWVSRRPSLDAPWGPPQNLGPAVNTAFNEHSPFLTIDGHRLFLYSDQPDGGFGGNDIYLARRRDRHDDFAWETPENLGPGVNTARNEGSPAFFEDEAAGIATLYFNSNRPGLGRTDIYASTRTSDDEPFGSAVLVAELSSSERDAGLAIRRDGLEMFLGSDRPGSIDDSFDVWVSTRANTTDPWSTPVNLGPTVNSAHGDSRVALSFDATELYIISDRAEPGNLDIWMATRERAR